MERSGGGQGRGDAGRYGMLAARVGFVAVLALATLIPFRLDLAGPAVMERLTDALHPQFRPKHLVDAARNLLLFGGWGVVWVTTMRSDRLITGVLPATFVGALISIGIETLQLLTTTRSPSVLDVLSNTAGAFIGAIAMVAFVAVVERQRGRRSFVGVPCFIFAGAYVGVSCVEAWLPPLLGVTYGDVWVSRTAPFELTVLRVELASALSLPLTDIVLFLPAGAFAVAALIELGFGPRRGALIAVAAGVLLFGPIEIIYGLLAPPVELGAFAVRALAFGAGALAVASWMPALTRRSESRARAVVFIGGYSLLLLLWAWRPYLPETDFQAVLEQLQPSRWLPLQAHRPEVDLFSVGDVLSSFLLFLPLGSLLAVRPLRRHGPLGYFLPAIYVAIVAELGQILVAGPHFDSTDILVGAAAAAVGWAVIRRSGYRPYDVPAGP